MQAKMENQIFVAQNKRHKDLWSSLYITDIPIYAYTNNVYTNVEIFCNNILTKDGMGIKEFSIQRNCILGFWEFKVITDFELMEFDVKD